jgi:hypothetical protein
MADYRDDRCILNQPLRDANGDIRPAAIIRDPQRELPTPNPAAGIDFLHGQLGGMPHRDPTRLGKGAGQSENDGAFFGASAGREDQGRGEEPAQNHPPGVERRVRARLRLPMG